MGPVTAPMMAVVMILLGIPSNHPMFFYVRLQVHVGGPSLPPVFGRALLHRAGFTLSAVVLSGVGGKMRALASQHRDLLHSVIY